MIFIICSIIYSAGRKREKAFRSYPSSLPLFSSPLLSSSFNQKSTMRIRKNLKITHQALPQSSHSAITPLQAHICQLNQSPWDVPPPNTSSPLFQVSSFTLSCRAQLCLSCMHRSDKPHFVSVRITLTFPTLLLLIL